MVDAIAEENALGIYGKGFEISRRPIALVFVQDIFKDMADRQVPGAILVPGDIPAVFGRFGQVVGISLLAECQFFPPGDLVAHDLQVGKLVDRIFEFGSGFLLLAAGSDKGGHGGCHQHLRKSIHRNNGSVLQR